MQRYAKWCADSIPARRYLASYFLFTFRGISAFLLAKAQAKGPDGGSGAPNGPNHTWRWDRAGWNIYLSSDQLPEAIVQP
jgi:hypothetical protein